MEGSVLEEQGKREKIKHDGQALCRARPSRVGNRFKGQPIKGSEASISLLQGSIMCPYDRSRGGSDVPSFE